MSIGIRIYVCNNKIYAFVFLDIRSFFVYLFIHWFLIHDFIDCMHVNYTLFCNDWKLFRFSAFKMFVSIIYTDYDPVYVSVFEMKNYERY